MKQHRFGGGYKTTKNPATDEVEIVPGGVLISLDLSSNKRSLVEPPAPKALADMDAPGYPIDFGNATSPPHWDTIVGHPCEGWVMTGQLPGGIAMYDDDPSMYEGAARYFFEGLLPVRQLAYKALKHYEGTHYTYARYEHEIASAMIWSAIGQPDVFPPTQPAVMSDYLYSLIPNGVSALLLPFREPSQSFQQRLRRRWWRTGTAR